MTYASLGVDKHAYSLARTVNACHRVLATGLTLEKKSTIEIENIYTLDSLINVPGTFINF